MLINSFHTPTNVQKNPSIHQSQQTVLKSPRDLKLRHQCRSLISLHNHYHAQNHHQRLHHRQRQQRCILLLIALILLLQIEVHTCRQLPYSSSERLSSGDEIAASSSVAIEPKNFASSISKRAELTNDADIGQPEEIFTVDDQMESNYDEYPMIVPKRAALLLDRLMVALHRALENERSKQRRIGELNGIGKNGNAVGRNDGRKSKDEGAELNEGATQLDSMYGDDPAVMMDYDFKDLNSINRATGETLMQKSFQRRANIGGAEGVTLLAATGARGVSNGLVSGGGGVGGNGGTGIGSGRISKGRMYWRCYFNAVTCF